MASDPRHAPLISVIIPVWNGERFVKEAVGSVLSQGCPSLEIVIVDDGSTDGTEAEVGALPCDVRYLKQENAGPAAARNRGILECSGDRIGFLDADDLWPQDHLKLLGDELSADEELDLVHGYGQLFECDAADGGRHFIGSPEEAFPHYIGAGLYRKRVFDRVGLFDPTLRFGEDTDWYTRARELDVPMKRLETVTLLVRRHAANMTQDQAQIKLSNLRVFKKALDRKRAESAPTPGEPPRGGWC
jgi:glycosyltransferase involved in cell wall biosynthesis